MSEGDIEFDQDVYYDQTGFHDLPEEVKYKICKRCGLQFPKWSSGVERCICGCMQYRLEGLPRENR